MVRSNHETPHAAPITHARRVYFADREGTATQRTNMSVLSMNLTSKRRAIKPNSEHNPRRSVLRLTPIAGKLIYCEYEPRNPAYHLTRPTNQREVNSEYKPQETNEHPIFHCKLPQVSILSMNVVA